MIKENNKRPNTPLLTGNRLSILEEQIQSYTLLSDLTLEAGRGLGLQTELEGLCSEMNRSVEFILPCRLFAVMQVEKSGAFEVVYCLPKDRFHALKGDINQLIDLGIFARAVCQSDSVACEVNGRWYRLLSLYAQGRVQGLLILQTNEGVGYTKRKALHHLADLFAIHFQSYRLQRELSGHSAAAAYSAGVSDSEALDLLEYDPLTGLLTRAGLNRKIEYCLTDESEFSYNAAMIILDLDGFQRLNEKHGHRKGKIILRGVADRLLSSLYRQATYDLLGIDEACISIARLGGDRFAIFFHRLVNSLNLEAVLGTLGRDLGDGFLLDNRLIYLTACSGVSLYPDDAHSIGSLLMNAGNALKEAKQQGRNKQVYRPLEAETGRAAVLDIEYALHLALHLNHFRIHYQPKLDLSSGKIVGAEALLRLPDGKGGFISPADFIPIAERADLIDAVGQWVMRAVSRQIALWKHQELVDIPISVNLSPQQLHGDDLAEVYSRIIEEEGVTSNCIELEVTETASIWDVERATENIRALHDRGFRMSLDDFGVGYSSFGRLKRYSFSEIKIDQSFIRHINESRADAAVVEMMVMLAERLGLRVVAEGVESEEQLKLLDKMGCRFVQGFYIAHPMEADHLVAMLAEP